MKIGIAGPILTAPFAEFLDCDITKAPKGLGGVSIVQLVKGLLKTGCNISIYSLDQAVTAPIVLKGNHITIYYGKYRRKHRMRDFMKIERRGILDSIIADNPDIVNAHWSYEFALGALASGKPTIVTVHDWAPKILLLNRSLYRFGRLLMCFTTMLRGSHFAANSPYIQKHLQRYIRRNIPIIPNGLEDELFYEGEKKLNLDQPQIVSLNNGFGTLKNVKTLLLAFKLIKKKIPNCHLLLGGYDFEKNGKAHQWAKENGYAEGVDFAGYVEHNEVLKILENADLLIHPSLEESFGLALLEAMAKKTPVIGGKESGAVPWVLNYGKAGVLVDVKSPLSIGNEAIPLLTSQERWEIFSISGYRYARGNFSLSKVVDLYLEAYHKVLRRVIAK